MSVTDADEQFLAQHVHRMRPDWQVPGIRVALQKVAAFVKPPDYATLAEGATRYANARDEHGFWKWETPGGMHMPGEHWAGTTIAQRKVPTMCGEHPDVPATRCLPCNRRPRTGAGRPANWEQLIAEGAEERRRERARDETTP